MDISKYIDEIIDETIINLKDIQEEEEDNNNKLFEENEDNYEEDYELEEYENKYLNDNYNPENLDSFDKGEYIIELMNIFQRYYNNKYNKCEHIFSGIELHEYKETKDTNAQMELFFESSIEFKQYSLENNINEVELLNMYYNKNEYIHNGKDNIYILEYNNKQIIAPCLFILINYIYMEKYKNNVDYMNHEINIYNLNENI